MKSCLLPAVTIAATLMLTPAGVGAQTPADPPSPTTPPVVTTPAERDAAFDSLDNADIEPEMAYSDYTIKGYTISVFGGAFGGDEYLNLPVRGPRTFEDEGADNVMAYDGNWLVYNRQIHDGPIKTINDATGFGLKVGSWLNDNVHVDLVLSYVATEAVLTMVNKTPDTEDANDTFREEMSRDDGVKVYRAGVNLTYEARQFEFFGIHPYVGFGFGGIITRFSVIDDTGELFFNGNLGLDRPITDNVSVFAQADMTTFAMSRDELTYTKQVNFLDFRLGLSWFIDVLPAGVRAAHEQDLQESETGRR